MTFFTYRDVTLTQITNEQKKLTKIEVKVLNVPFNLDCNRYDDGVVNGVSAKLEHGKAPDGKKINILHITVEIDEFIERTNKEFKSLIGRTTALVTTEKEKITDKFDQWLKDHDIVLLKDKTKTSKDSNHDHSHDSNCAF